MAKGTKLGGTAARVVTIGDLDALVDRTGHQNILDGIEKVELSETAQRAEQYVGQTEARIQRVKQRIESRSERRQERNARQQDKADLSEAWRRVGIRSKFVLVDAPFAVRIGACFLFGTVDFYLFATAMVVAMNASERDKSGFLGYSSHFWTGGVMGLMVFVLGVALAHLIRQSDYIRAQQDLKRELQEEGQDTRSLILSANSRNLQKFIGTLFGILNFVALLVRAQGVDFRFWPPELDRIGPLLLQMLVPVVAVGAEAIMFDPTEVRIREPGPVDWILARRQRSLEQQLTERHLRVNKLRDNIVARYDVERASLRTFHDSQGFPNSNMIEE